MVGQDYWLERETQNAIKAERYTDRQIELITRWFSRAKKEMSAKILDFYRKYADTEGITLPEAKKRLNDPKLLKTTLEEYAALAEQAPDNAEIKAYLDKLGLKRSISRLEFLQLQLDLILDQTYLEYDRITTETLTSTFEQGYYKALFDYQQFVGFGSGFNRLSTNQIMAAITTNWSGKNYSERIWGEHRQSLARRVNRIITTGMITGRSNKEMRQQLEKEMDIGTYNARRLIRTESCYVTGQAHMRAYKQNGTKKYRYFATLDLKTSEICRELDGKVFDVKKAQVCVNYPPMHPHCRSRTAPEVSDAELDEISGTGTRTARDHEGNSYTVPADMTYKDWYAKYVEGVPDAELYEKKIKNIYADNVQYDKYKALVGKDAPKSLDDMQTLKYTDSDGWEDLKAFARYKRKYPDSDRIYFNVNKDIKKLQDDGILSKRIGVAIKPQPIKVTSYSSHALQRMFERGFGTEDAQANIDNAFVAFSQFKGTRTAFYTDNGTTAVLNSSQQMITGWMKPDHDESTDEILKVVHKHGR